VEEEKRERGEVTIHRFVATKEKKTPRKPISAQANKKGEGKELPALSNLR